MALRITEVTYTDLKGRVLTFPVGNTGNTITAKYKIDCKFRVDFTDSLQVVKNDDQMTLIGSNPDGGALTWESFGITPGTVFFGLYISGGSSYTGSETIVSVQGADLFLSAPITSAPNGTYYIGNFTQLKTPEGFDLFFNVSPNDTKTEISPIDGGVQRFQVDNVQFTPVGTTLDMVQLGNKSGASDLTVQLKVIADGLVDKSQFELYITYRYPNYLDQSLFANAGTVMPYLKLHALAEFANPNAKLTRIHEPDGNIGYFDEHFNGGISPYIFQSIAWSKLSGAPLPAMDFSQTSKFEALITGNFDSACQFNMGWFWHPLLEDDVKGDPDAPIPGLPTSHDQNVMLVTKTTSNSTIFSTETIIGYANSTGAQLTITNLQYTVIGSGVGATLKITGRTVPNTEFTEWFETREGDRRVKIWVDCDESAYNFDWNSSTSTNVTVYDDQMIKTPIPLGAWDDVEYYKYLDHNDDEFVNPVVYTEDDLNLVVRFRLPKNTEFQSIATSIVAYKPSTGDEFTLETQVANITPSDILPFLPDGSLPISVVENRGFKQPNGTGKNEFRLERYDTIDTGLAYGLRLNYGFLCRWEYWLQQLNANVDFFATKNKNWQHYSATSGWGLKAKLEITNENGTYTNGFPFSIRAYDDYTGASVLEFFLLDGTPVSAPPTDQPSKVKLTHTISSPYTWLAPFWANHRVEVFEGGPSWMLSSRAYTLDPANPLYPMAGEVGVKITVTGDEAVTECLFDPTKIPNSGGLSFNGRIQGFETPEKGSKFLFDDGSVVTSDNGNNLIQD